MPTSPETIRLSGSNLVFVNSYTSSVSDAYRTAIVAAENELQSHFSNNVTITVSFGFANLSSALAQNSFGNSLAHVSYSTLANALRSHATTADDLAAVNALPAVDPTGGAGFLVAGGEARLLGLPGAGTSSTPDVTLTLGSAYTWNFDPNNRGAAGGYDAIGTIEHEITEGGFGRVGGLGFQNSAWGPMDLFRFTSSGQRDYTGGRDGQAAFFSPNGAAGNILTQFHNSISTTGKFDGQDPADWAIGGDSFGFGGKGTIGVLSNTDLRVLDILGWTPRTTAVAQTDDFANSLTDTTHSLGQVNAGASATGNINFLGDRDWFKVQLVQDTKYTINLQGQQGNVGTLEDPYVRLHSSTGATLGENDDISAGVQRDSQLVFTPTSTGTYYIEAGSYNDQYTGTYAVSVFSGNTDDFANSLADTTHVLGQLPVGGTALGTIEVVGDRDWFKLQLTAGSTYTFGLSGQQGGGGTLADPYLRLHAGDGTVVTENDDIVVGINRDSQLVYTATATGTYYVEAGAFDDSSTGTYKASVVGTNLVDDSITRLYVGYFNRAPDPAGETYWAAQLQGGMALSQIAQSYSVQTEATSQYAFLASPNASSTAAVTSFVDAVYSNLFNRAPDTAGESFWVGQLQTGASTVGGAIINIISGAQGNDAATIVNKVAVGTYYDQSVFANSVQSSTASAKSALSAVTSSTASVTAGKAIVDAYVATAPLAVSEPDTVDLVGMSLTSDLAHWV